MLTDFKRLLALLVIAAGVAFLINHLRADSQGMAYATPVQQMASESKRPGLDSNAPPVTVVGIDRVIHAVNKRTHLIIDARPDLFWEIGHIPGAISLPRKQFAEYYPKTESILREAVAMGRPLLLYCADLHCPDAGALAKELNQRGFNGVLLFEAGWGAWEEAGQAVESK